MSKRLVLSLCAMWLLWGGSGALADGAGAPTSAPLEVRLTSATVTHGRFLGFGGEWDPKFWADYNLRLGVNEADWQRVVQRVHWMRIPLVRMMMLSRWCTQGDGRFDWQSPDMQSLYRHLDVCQREGIQVVLTDWGCVVPWNRVPGFHGMDDPAYAEAIGKYLDHLIRTKGYTCIRYFVLGNEPNLEGFGWEQWKKGVENVRKELEKRGLKLAFVGSDESCGPDWHRRAVDEMASSFDLWDVHDYASQSDVAGGEFEKRLRRLWDYALKNDPKASDKPFVICEAGMSDGQIAASGNSNIDTYGFGVFMADYAVQATRAGSAWVLAWMLDDSSHEGFRLGMWKDKSGGFAFRRWFYPWGLLVRYVPAGAELLKVEDPSPQLRVLAARLAEGKEWSFCVVNRGDQEASVRLSGGDSESRQYRLYLYSEAKAPTDAQGFPVAAEAKQARLDQGLVLSCPANSVVLATTVGE